MTPQSDVALAPFCTMNVGGPARWFVEARTESDLVGALEWAAQRGAAVHVLGGGSNIVVSDAGFDGLVIRVHLLGVESAAVAAHRLYIAGAGEPWEPFVAQIVSDDCAGIECLSGIPGLVGGTPIQNVGAYGQEVSSTITRVHAIDRTTGMPRSFSTAQCGFGYRTSRFRHADAERYVVTRVEFVLTPYGPPTTTYADVVAFLERAGMLAPTLQHLRTAILEIRRRKGMVIEDGNPANRSCGSFFVNPVVSRDELDRVQATAGTASVPHFAVDAQSAKIPAAWLIERSGFARGVRRGTVGISPFQAQAVVNLGGASASDVLALACDVKRAVWRTFRISLVPEPVFVGFGGAADLRFLLTHLRTEDDLGEAG
ncbi:MAG TPA: UDP-N-acetylmuramate dehydrogenase [Vicinamibacterales bacterium]|nr:UDP-N-acetylmuramate dehydrogenase [Vicinamibacterales bacterium]